MDKQLILDKFKAEMAKAGLLIEFTGLTDSQKRYEKEEKSILLPFVTNGQEYIFELEQEDSKTLGNIVLYTKTVIDTIKGE